MIFTASQEDSDNVTTHFLPFFLFIFFLLLIFSDQKDKRYCHLSFLIKTICYDASFLLWEPLPFGMINRRLYPPFHGVIALRATMPLTILLFQYY